MLMVVDVATNGKKHRFHEQRLHLVYSVDVFRKGELIQVFRMNSQELLRQYSCEGLAEILTPLALSDEDNSLAMAPAIPRYKCHLMN